MRRARRLALIVLVALASAGCTVAPDRPAQSAPGGERQVLEITLTPPDDSDEMARREGWLTLVNLRVAPGPVTVTAMWDDTLDVEGRLLSAVDFTGDTGKSLARSSSGSPPHAGTTIADITIGLYTQESTSHQTVAILDTPVTNNISATGIERQS